MSDPALDDTVAPLRSAVEALSRGDWSGVQRVCDVVTAEADTEPTLRGEALLLRAIARHASGDASGALADGCGAFLAWRGADRAWLARRLISLGSLLAAAGDTEGVRRYVDLAVSAANNSLEPAAAAEVAASAAGVLASAGLDREARGIWEACLERSPDAPPPLALVNLARFDIESGDLGVALSRLHRALNSDPERSLAGHAVAVALDMCALLAEAGDLAAAGATVDRLALWLKQDAPESLRIVQVAVEHDRGVALLEAGDLEGAAEHFVTAIADDADPRVTASALLSLASIEAEFGRVGVAVEHIRQAGQRATDVEQIEAAAVLARAVADTALERMDRDAASIAYSVAAGLFNEAGQGRLAELVAAQAVAAASETS